MTYSAKLVARIKGALRCGFKPKQISYLTGIPIETIKNWAQEDSRGSIEADDSICEDIRIAFAKEN